MIKFFRKIRQKLLAQNKFRSYLVYAVGEIVLVVIGILIALSINNWNEERKLRSSEKLVLKTLLGEFRNNLNNIEPIKIQADTIVDSAVELANLINTKAFIQDTIRMPQLFFNICFTSPYLRLDNGVLNDVINSGKLNIIKSDSLRAKLGAFESYKLGLEKHQDFIGGNNQKVLKYQLEKGNFRKHIFAINKNTAKLPDLNPSAKPFNYNFTKTLPFENDLMMYISSLNAYREGTLIWVKNYLNSTIELTEKELAK
ncbi:DUF6090 family protein [Seonamhaeicola maritimus]|uniref:DUF6090 family protein n=1 Tax=Seonamhaeicola maritimus TaxID=2591822 RepID=UPI0024944981|nr:DUF6090 family protein [Seonamhaeicola maritimus]